MKKFLATLFMVLSFTCAINVFATEVGDKAPSIVLDDIQIGGDVVKQSILANETGKRFVLLEFMSINCGQCVANLPNLQQLNHDLAAVATVRMISLDRNQQLVMDFLSKYRTKIDYPFSLDPNRETLKAYKINATPTTFIVNENGVVIYKHVGSYDRAIMDEIRSVIANN